MKTTVERPADSAGALYFRTDISPEQIFQAIGRLRKEARDEIDRLSASWMRPTITWSSSRMGTTSPR